MLAAALW